jgi:hypothetical protein
MHSGSMTTIACSLPAAQYRDRTDEIRRFAHDAVRDRHAIDGGVRLTFDATARERLEAFVAAEGECCPFLTMDLRTAGDGLVLEVTGPEAAAPVIAELLAG